ncbi:class I SAM-dependent methyltransferase [Bradyrhizobium guangzhouense]|uniref:class I SAM-dependent methyltransferase n=1 Tax=Bradyrhizobium guangzhouense TaxID=1325095 RepID=UPI001009D6DB|nr:class I SAM-dependent methyltransferase [Bradyrhizobium guangzhouense]RXH16964.1 class I SAM-dependent methyltransferase [Bradyrhizobium guangzhouense]
MSKIDMVDAVRWAYRLFLDREPEDATAADNLARSCASVSDVRLAFLNSSEFRNRADAVVTRVPVNAKPIEVDWEPDPASCVRLLEHVRQTWTKLGESAPHWSVLSADRFLPESISGNEVEFYNSGTDDVANISATLKRLGYDLGDFRRLYEYGCGVGRVTLPLAMQVDHVTAGDISTSHLQIARARLNADHIENVSLVHVQTDERYGMLEPFDFWYSRIVLQHNPPPIIALILRRAFEMLEPGGIACFQLPTYAVNYSYNTEAYLAALKGSEAIEMHCLPQSAVFSIAREYGCIPLEVREDDSVGYAQAWISNQFVFVKNKPV